MTRSAFGMAETSEVLRRTWHVEERSVRPDHRMVGHTGFLTTARLLVPPDERRPVPETDLAEADAPHRSLSRVGTVFAGGRARVAA